MDSWFNDAIQKIRDCFAERDQLKQELAQAQAAPDPNGEVVWLRKDNDLLRDEAKRLEAQCADMRDALLTCDKVYAFNDRTIAEQMADNKAKVEAALSTTAGTDLLARLENITKDRDALEKHLEAVCKVIGHPPVSSVPPSETAQDLLTRLAKAEEQLKEAVELLGDSRSILVSITLPEWIDRREAFLASQKQTDPQTR